MTITNGLLSQGGRFFGRLVERVIAAHLDLVGPVFDKTEIEQKPVGLLITAIQAVRDSLPIAHFTVLTSPHELQVTRALEHTLATGNTVIDSSSRDDHFSKDNWGDFSQTVLSRGGTVSTVKHFQRATVFKPYVDILTEDRWTLLFNLAEPLRAKKQGRKKKVRVIEVEGDEEQDAEQKDVVLEEDSMFVEGAAAENSEESEETSGATSSSGSGESSPSSGQADAA